MAANILDSIQALVEGANLGNFRKRTKARKIYCPHPDYEDAYVVLPAEWTGRHAQARSEVISIVGDGKASEYYNTAIALVLAEEWGNIQGIEGDDPSKWNLDEVPIPVMVWLTREVIHDFNSAFRISKN